MSKATLMARVWADLSAINVNDHVQKKGNLSYLSWTWAWSTLMAKYPESYYVFQDHSEADGSVMVECVLTIHEGEEVATRTMWLPVMDHKNKAINNPNARDISDARMRCLVKCLAMFGLGFYIYAGEDIPEAEAIAQTAFIGEKDAKDIEDKLKHLGPDVTARFLNHYKIKSPQFLTVACFEQAYNMLSQRIAEMESATAVSDEIIDDDSL